MRSPLDGITVLDMTHWQNGPWGTVMLSDMGANIIKIEDPISGDPGRSARGMQPNPDGPSTYFQTMNRNKRAMTLDLKKQQGRDIFYSMAKQADVITQNFRKGVVDKLLVGYETIREINPRIVYASVNGFGPKGPDAYDGVFDILGQARGGFMYLNSIADDDISYRVSGGLADQVGAITLAYGVLLGIVARERFGIGQHVQTSQLGGQMMLQALALNAYPMNGDLPQPRRRESAANPLFSIYKCADGRWIAIGCIQSDRYWRDFVQVLEIEQFEEDPRFCDMNARTANSVELVKVLDGVFVNRTCDEWMALLKPRGVNCAKVQTYEDIAHDPQVIENDYITAVEHPTFGTLTEVGVPVALSETPGWARSAAPEFGQHTEEILQEFGYDWDQIAEFRDKGVI